MKKTNKRKWLWRSLPFLLILIIETVLRLTGIADLERFDFLALADEGIYPPGKEMEYTWGKIRYTVRTNTIGLRGHEAKRNKPAGKIRLIGIGDSVTDGFFVDNKDTYPAQLTERFNRSNPGKYEVLSAARGGGSIGKSIGLLRKVALPLDPDHVILTFVTNDISDLKGVSQDLMLQASTGMRKEEVTWKRKAFNGLLRNSAIVSMLYGAWYDRKIRPDKRFLHLKGDDRYKIEGNDRFRKNTKQFLEETQHADGLVLGNTFDHDTDALFNQYLVGLQTFKSVCDSHEVGMTFVFFPAYNQVYDTSASLLIRDRLQTECKHLNVPFCDLTPALRNRGASTPLHLAPIDYHPNPIGNRVMAEAIHDFLLQEVFVPDTTSVQ